MKLSLYSFRIKIGHFLPFIKPYNVVKYQPKTILDTGYLANKKLQERLVYYTQLMTDIYTGDILDLKSGKKFTGKFVVPADKFEHIYHINNGEVVGGMVRLKSGQKQWAWHGKRDKFYKLDMPVDEIKKEKIKMEKADNDAEAQMRDNFIIKKLLALKENSIIF